jgi:hypothetical protein
MEGREHKNKGIAAFCNRHYPGEEETSKRGRKTEAQRELEKQIVEKEKDIDLEVNAIFVKFHGKGGTKDEIEELAPGFKISKLTRPQLIEFVKKKKKKNKSWRKRKILIWR